MWRKPLLSACSPWRAHWGIENRLHHVRDVSMDEYRCPSRAAGRALDCLRNLTLTTIRKFGLSAREAGENFREDRANTSASPLSPAGFFV